jgi:uncharacterized membrane protein YfhO
MLLGMGHREIWLAMHVLKKLEVLSMIGLQRAFKFNYYNFSIYSSISGRMVISIQQRQQFAQIT